MFIKQIYTNCLAHAAYYIESGNEAAVIDPLRDPEPYIQLAAERGARIKYVFETHFHADFVSGHIDLGEKTGAVVVFGPGATPGYKAYIADDGERLKIGDCHIQIVHTPGHTIESTCFLLLDAEDKMCGIFTGDTLFVGEVGRPDLLSGNLPKEELAAMLFESIQNKIKTLPDDLVVYPGHGAGSACGKNIGKESTSTIGKEKASNYALLINDKAAFIEQVTTDLPHIPGYFFKDAVLNKGGYNSFDSVMENSLKGLSVTECKMLVEGGAMVLDTRDPMVFAAGYIPGAVNVGLTGDFAVWVGTIVDADATLLLVTDAGREREAIERLARIGYEKVAGYLAGGMEAWFASDSQYEKVMTFDGKECSPLLETEDYALLDVRNRLEVARHRIAGSVHIPLNLLRTRLDGLDKNTKWLVYCAGGYRSMIAASILKANGYHFVASIEGGIKEVIQHAPELVEMDVE